MIDPQTGQPKIKVYTDIEGVPKGDARICYSNPESVQMALEWLNGSDVRPGYPVKVEEATFKMKGDTYRPRETVQKLDKVEKMRIKAEMGKQKAWEDSELHHVGLKVVILQGFYTQDEMQTTMAEQGITAEEFFQELEQELRVEIEEKIGSVAKIDFFKDNPACVCKLRFLSSLHADQCIQLMNGRYFDTRQLKCFYWDGKTDFKIVRESDEVMNARINEFGDWLEN